MNDRTVARSRPEQAGSYNHHDEGDESSDLDTTGRLGSTAAVTP
ncbi:hypothetical protein ACSW29_12555 [Rhodococcus sp. GB-02]